MMAEAGAYTPRHYDSLGFGTMICCYEGEIGFAYQTTSLESQAAQKARQKQEWLYRVIRPREVVYVPPGIYHTVFRAPEGSQTLATAMRVLRYRDTVTWLKILLHDFDCEIAQTEPSWFARSVRGLVMGTWHFLDIAKTYNDAEKFGGARMVEEAERLLVEIDRKLKKMLTGLTPHQGRGS